MKIQSTLPIVITFVLSSIFCGQVVSAQDYPYQDSSLSSQRRAEDLMGRLTLEQKVSQLKYESEAIPEFGIHQYNWWNEALHGAARAGLATVFPQSIGMAASWDPELLEKVFDIASTEQRIKFNEARSRDSVTIYHGLTVWTPNINIFRDPRWGRGQETYGEDPFLTAVMGTAVVKGLQGPSDARYDKLHACVKHFAIHSGPEPLRHRFNIESISLRDLRETYLYAFKKIVQGADVKQVMCAYNAYEGKPCCSSDKLLTRILREEWGYRHVVVTDCGAVSDNYKDYGHNQYPGDPAAASAAALRSGADMECGGNYPKLVEAVRRGLIDEAEIDSSFVRVFRSRFDLGEMDDPGKVCWSSIPNSALACIEHRKCALEMARETMVLLQNDGTLPLRKDIHVAVLGPNAADRMVHLGNYNGDPASVVSILDGIRNTVGEDNVSYFKACSIAQASGAPQDEPFDLSLVKDADAIVFVGGISPSLEGEEMPVSYNGFKGGDRVSIELPSPQRKLVAELATLGKPLVFVNLSGSAVGLEPESGVCNAMIQGWYGGESGGQAVAEVIFGDYNPAGRLPVTFYTGDAQLMDFEDYDMEGKTYRYFKGKPLFPFGHGLSYTSFQYGKASYKDGRLSFTITNTGERDGDEVAQVYVSRLSDKEGPTMSLRGFKRVHVLKGQTVTVDIPVEFDLFDPRKGDMVDSEGAYRIFYGGSSDKSKLSDIKIVL